MKELDRSFTAPFFMLGWFLFDGQDAVKPGDGKDFPVGFVDMAQLHGHEDEAYLKKLRALTQKPLIRAFCVTSAEDIHGANASTADFVLLDSGAGSGRTFAWELLRGIRRPYFLAGGLTPENVAEAIEECRPFAVDVSSGIETAGRKDPAKMNAFCAAVRKE